MCMFSPKVPDPKPPAQFQPVLQPQELQSAGGVNSRKRRGLYGTVFTSPQGVSGPPRVTGTMGGMTGG